ncbi:MAG: hypothetical protein AB1345_07615 [Chloroflexota bacterium]
MRNERRAYIAVILILVVLFVLAVRASAAPPISAPLFPITPTGQIATEAELTIARDEWAQSAHADTYDNGMGANTTCARCKSPLNWDPSQDIAQQEALDCNACKRIPGAPRPELLSGVAVSEFEWQNIGCEVCHIPAGDSYYTGIAFWDQASGQYQEVGSVMELCAHCHEGQHGFKVIEEQMLSKVHVNMQCTECHGTHGAPSTCTDCHDPTTGRGASDHARHLNVNCTACHDAGGLSIWLETDPQSPHLGEYITRRFAHTLTSWPSHNLQLESRCERCHHPLGEYQVIVASEVSCSACHPNGAVIFWCEFFPRNSNPNPSIVPEVIP